MFCLSVDGICFETLFLCKNVQFELYRFVNILYNQDRSEVQ